MSTTSADSLSPGHGDDLDFNLEDALFDDLTTKRRKSHLFTLLKRRKQIDAIYSLGSDAGGRVGEDVGYLVISVRADAVSWLASGWDWG